MKRKQSFSWLDRLVNWAIRKGLVSQPKETSIASYRDHSASFLLQDQPSLARRAAFTGAIGALAFLATPADANTVFTSYSFPGTGFPTSRTMPARIADIKNVKDWGAVGDGVTDDRAAIQAAVDYATAPYSSANRGIIFFPVGTYLISSAVTFETSTIFIQFLGAPGAKITGNFADAILKRSPNSPISGVHVVENLYIVNSNAAGKGVMLHSCVQGAIINCWIDAKSTGAETFNSQSVWVVDTQFSGSGGTGLEAGNATAVISCDFSGWTIGVRHQNAGCIIQGGRFEVNTTGIILGEDQNGNALQTTSFDVSGMSMESNTSAIVVRAATGGRINFSSGAGQSGIAYGLRCISINNATITAACSSSMGFSVAGISIEGCTNATFISCGSTWSIATGLQSFQFINCNQGELTFSQLPTAPVPMTELPISNANTGTVGSAVTGTGTSHVIAKFVNGSWKVIASA